MFSIQKFIQKSLPNRMVYQQPVRSMSKIVMGLIFAATASYIYVNQGTILTHLKNAVIFLSKYFNIN